jgi:hypothetical protein
MNLENLASISGGSSSTGPQTLLDWLVLGGICVVAAIGIIALLLVLNRVSREEPKIKGPAPTGTARVLSMKTGIAVGNYPQRIMCRIGLTVEVPGRQPYDVRVRQGFLPWAMDAIEPGRTVPVQVDSTNPQKVRIDFNQPNQAARIAIARFAAKPDSLSGPVQAEPWRRCRSGHAGSRCTRVGSARTGGA